MEELKRQNRELSDRVHHLAEVIDANTLALNQVHDRQDRSERKGRFLVLGAIVLLGGFLLLGWVAWQQHRTDERLSIVVQDSLCPVYALVVGGYDPDSRSLNPDGSYEGSARQKYIDNHQVMSRAYDQLGCANTSLVPPRTNP